MRLAFVRAARVLAPADFAACFGRPAAFRGELASDLIRCDYFVAADFADLVDRFADRPP